VCFYWIVQKSRSFSIVLVEQTTESLPFDQRAICLVIAGRLDHLAVKALMRAEADEWRRRIVARQRFLDLPGSSLPA
jgi:flagellar motor component MotA